MDIETVTSRFREAAAVGVVRLRAGLAIREASRYPAIRSLMLRNGWHAPLRFSACCRRAQPPICTLTATRRSAAGGAQIRSICAVGDQVPETGALRGSTVC